MKNVFLGVLFGIVLVAGLACVIVGVCLIPYFHRLLRDDVKRDFQLTNDSGTFERWSKGSGVNPRIEYFYVFNVTNPEEVIRDGKNVTVEEIGPFAYSVSEKLTNISFDSGMKTLNYTLKKSYAFDESLSKGLNDTEHLTVVNVPILSLLAKLRTAGKKKVKDATKMLAKSNETLFTSVSVRDLLWGYENPVLKQINNKTRLFKDTRIGIFYQSDVERMSRLMGSFSISTGNDNISTVWNIRTWNKNRTLSYWTSKDSNSIRGTSGYSWHPYLKSSDTLDRFDPDWFRSTYLTHEGQRSIGNLTSDLYAMPASVLNYSLPENQGFCQKTPNKTKCLGTGLLNITTCSTEKIPWILSQPHFYDADPKYSKEIHGMTPANKTLHESRLDVDLLTGEVIEAQYTKQFNVYVANDSHWINQTKDFASPVVIPVAWLREVYSVSMKERERIRQVHDDLSWMRAWYDRMQYGLIGVGAFVLLVLLVVLIVVLVMKTRNRGEGEREPLLHR